MAANTQFFVSKTSQGALIDHHKFCLEQMNKQYSFREQMRNIDLSYAREQDQTQENQRAKAANRAGDSDRIQNITIPVVKPQVRAAVGYQAGVFLTDYPIFGVVADPANIDAAKQMQAIIEENSIRTGWARELLLFFYDGFKYDLSAIECTWDKIVTAAVETDVSYKGGKEGKPVELIWQGNRLKRWNMYNTYFDTRCLPYEIPDKGEFCGTTELYSKVALKSLIAKLDTKIIENIQPAFESPSFLNIGASGTGNEGYYIPNLNSDLLIDQNSNDIVDWDRWVGLAPANTNSHIKYKGLYEVSTEYVRILPSEFGLRVPAPNTPQVWKLIIVNHSVVIFAERMTNAHEKIPVFFGQPSEDGLGYQTKSLATDARPFQQVASSIMNGVLAAKRRAVTDRVLYDPSRVSEAHINNPNPSAKIPVRPSAFGKNITEAVYQFPYRDDQSAIGMQEINTVVQLGNTLNGQNQARQGQFVKGNKTDGQWEQTMSNATTQDRLTALLYESQVFTPLKEVIKLNILQYQTGGQVFSPRSQEATKIDPLVLRNAILSFKVTDGLLPSDKVLSADQQKTAMQVIGSSPTLAQGYNVAPLFSYIMKTDNVNFAPFEKSPQQIAYEQALGAWNNAVTLYAQKGIPFTQPQPKPQEYNFDPASINPQAQAQTAPATVPQLPQ
jgi:hypothetical protein